MSFLFSKPKWHEGPLWERALRAYDVMARQQFEATSSKRLVSKYGSTQVYTCGDESKPAVFLFHGMGANSMMFGDWLVPVLRQHFYTVCIDTPGDVGLSCPKDGDEQYIPSTKEEFTEWFLDMQQQLGLSGKKVHLIGFSYGCYIASQLALMVPESVEKVCFLAPAAVFSGIARGWLFRAIFCVTWAALMPTESLKKYAMDYFMAYMSEHYHEQKKTWKPDYAEMRAACGSISPVIKMNPEELDMNSLQRIASKSMLVLGDKETVIDPARAIQRATEAGVPVKVYKDAGHLLYAEYTRDIAKQDVLDFFLRD